MGDRLRIVVAGMAGYFPLGGVAWDYLQYAMGFAAMGHDVYYYEDMNAWAFDPTTNEFTDSPTYTVKYLSDFFERYAPDLSGRWHYRHMAQVSFGVDSVRMREILGSADLFVNVSGVTRIPAYLSSSCITVFLDTDPGYNQIVLERRLPWHPNVDGWAHSVMAHNLHATYAENINATDCLVPHAGLTWVCTRPPVYTPIWRAAPIHGPSAPWTTVMTWNGFKGRLEFEGATYGSKELEFPKIESLPSRLPLRFNIAVGGGNAPVERIRTAGWAPLANPGATVYPDQYQQMIQESRGEISVAKNVYVAPRTGWFSGRSTCYLASGRPVVAQDTGYSRYIPPGSGLIGFTTLDDAIAALETIESNYAFHAKAAREIAMEYFDSTSVLSRLIDDIYASHETPADEA